MTTAQDVTGAIAPWDPYARDCPSRDLLDKIGSKWAVLVLGELGANGPRRFSRLRQRLSGVSEKMLTQTLRTLERDGLVLRTVYREIPPRVEYQLTPLGHTLRDPLRALTEWSVEYIADVLAAREQYDVRTEAAR